MTAAFKPPCPRALGVALAAISTALGLHPVSAADLFVFGGERGPTWGAAAAEAPVIDLTSRPGWILPSSVQEQTNVAAGSLERGGYLVSPNAQAVLRLSIDALRTQLAGMVDGDHATAFEVKDVVATGVFIVLDLGARFGVNHVRFFPRAEFRTDFMKGYVLSINDGAFGADVVAATPDKLPSRSLFTIAAQENSNNRDTVDVRFPLQYVRYVRLESTQRFNWEIDELELFGRGFVPGASYLTTPANLGRPSLWGRVHWGMESVGRPEKSRITVRSRSGDSAVPDSTWSPWSAPYEASGDLLASPSPRRFLQFRIDFESDGLADGAAVDSLAFEHSAALATATAAELWPQEVAVGRDTTFTYAVRLTGARGVDRLEVDTGAPVVAVSAVRVDGQAVAFTAETGEAGLAVGFPRQQGNRLLEVEFDTAVLRYETVFAGRLVDTASDDLPQQVAGGEATDQLPGGDLTVRVPLQGGQVLQRVTLAPNPFSPNGDGTNDETVVVYDVVHLTRAVPVRVRVTDLSGRRVVALVSGPRSSGRHLLRWSGFDERGRPVPPGLYLVQVEVETDSGTQRSSGVVGVAY